MKARVHAAAAAVAAAVLLLAAPALAEVRKVPSEAYPTIQSAVDAAGDGDVILVAKSPTAYGEDLLLEGKSNLTIRGAGRATGISGLLLSEDATIRISGGSNITLRGLVVSPRGPAVSVSVQATGVAGLQIVDVDFKGGGQTGLSTTDCTGVLVSRCAFSGLDAEMILDEGSSGFTVERCFFLYPHTFAVRVGPGGDPVEGGAGVVLRRNVVKGAGVALPGSGFQVIGDGTVVDRNVLTGLTGEDGISVSGSGVVVSRNRVESGGTAIVTGGGAATVDRNVVSRAGGSGIFLGSTPATVTGNRIANVSEVGIFVVHAGVTVSGNRATGGDPFDLADLQAEGVNTYGKNRFGTMQFSFVP